MSSNLSANCQVFVPRGMSAMPQSFTSEYQKHDMPVHTQHAPSPIAPANTFKGGFGDFSNQMLQVPTHQPKLNYSGNSVSGHPTYNDNYSQNFVQGG